MPAATTRRETRRSERSNAPFRAGTGKDPARLPMFLRKSETRTAPTAARRSRRAFSLSEPFPMTPSRLSLTFLSVAALAGVGGLGVVELLELTPMWATGLRVVCVGALGGFLVSFLVGLDRSALVRR